MASKVAKKETFEQKIEKINEIIEKLEDKEIELEDSLKLYEECVTHINEAEKILEETKGKIQKITKKDKGYVLEDIEG